MKIEQADGELLVTRPTERGEDRALHGLTRTLIANMVEGVTKGFEKHLEIQGVGYRASLRGSDLELNVGYSHSVVIKPRPGITFEVPAPTQVIVKGTDKQQVGQTAAEVRQVRPPEPYKGKGIRYQDEYVRRKVVSAHELRRLDGATPRSGGTGFAGAGAGMRRLTTRQARERRHRGSGARSPARPSGRASRFSARTRASSPS